MDKKIDVMFSCDTTGSMAPCIAEARRRIKETVKQIFDAIPGVRIGLMFHGDYYDEGKPYIITGMEMTRNVSDLVGFVNQTKNTCGGDWEECYEKVLHHAQDLNWRRDADARVLVMIGDALPHQIGYRYGRHRNSWDWKHECRLLNDMGVNVYAVQAMAGQNSLKEKDFWKGMAARGGGKYLQLNQLSHIIQLIQGVCYHLDGKESFQKFENDIKESGMFNRSIAAILDGLAGREESSFTFSSDTGLKPVDPSRFQVLHVDDDCVIKDFVKSTGAPFRKGRGFYQFTKTETVQEQKEVVLVDKTTGDMWSGASAREMIGVPYGERGRVRPAALPYDVFIQSTSWNRKLKSGTRFLYETDRI